MADANGVDRLVSYSELAPVFGIRYTRMQLARLESAGKFPRRVVLSPRRIAWKTSELVAWIDEKAASRPSNRPGPSVSASVGV